MRDNGERVLLLFSAFSGSFSNGNQVSVSSCEVRRSEIVTLSKGVELDS